MVEYIETNKKYFYKIYKNGEKIRISKNEYNNKIKKGKILYGWNKKLQDDFIDEIFLQLKTKTIKDINYEYQDYLCTRFINEILPEETYEFIINIKCFNVISLLGNMLIHIIYKNLPSLYDKFNEMYSNIISKNIYNGKTIKEYELTNLTPDPIKAFEILSTCLYGEEYCVMDTNFLYTDYPDVKYLCNKNNINSTNNNWNNLPKIKKINNPIDLEKIKDSIFIYCILPNETLVLGTVFSRNSHHSMLSCGQSVICAGHL